MWEKIKQRSKSKTYWLAIALAALGAVQIALPVVQDRLHPLAFAWGTVIVAVAVAVLRELTVAPLDEK